MSTGKRACALLLAFLLLAAVPRHVPTADYFGGYSGTKTVPAQAAAPLLTWAETDQPGSRELAPLGVKPFLYSNPNIEMPGDPLYNSSESAFYHYCGGGRVRIRDARGFDVMNPGSTALRGAWRRYVQDRTAGADFYAVFEDEAAFPSVYRVGDPCNYTPQGWLSDLIQAQRMVGFRVIYNGLSDFYNHGVAREIALNATAIGGMMEQCYATSPPHPLATGWQWIAEENTEILMARAHKYFFCLGNDQTPADQVLPLRQYVYASYALTYDPRSSILMEFYKTPSFFHVLPESRLVPWNPVRQNVRTIDDLRQRGGAYVREYHDCYYDGRRVGACAVAVNPDERNSVPLYLNGYGRTLQLQGSGVYDGGTAFIARSPVPRQLGPLSAVVAFR